jgi:cation diffusion facilitator CzcD-associated flavoprotein CzcO
MKAHYRKRLIGELEKYIKDDRVRRHMTPGYELGCRRVIPTNAYLPALARGNVDVDITEEVTSLSPEPATGFILSRRWFRLSDYRLLR